MRRLVYWIYRFYTGTRHRARRRLTRPGLALLGGLAVTGLLSMDISASLAYQVFTLMLCLLAAAFASSIRFRSRFSAQRVIPRFATAGVPLSYRILLRNESGSRQQGLLVQENLADPRPSFDTFAALQRADEKRLRSFNIDQRLSRWSFEQARVEEAPVPALERGQEVEVHLRLTPRRRGQIELKGLTVGRPDPLGLVKAFHKIRLPHTLLVLPRRYPLPPIPLPGAMKYQPGGVAMASSVGESEEFVALRDYRQGDPLRRIHWRSWARVGHPIVKEYQDEFFVRHALVLDTFTPDPRSELLEEAVSVAASFACTIQTQESLLDLLFVGAEAYCFTAGRGLAHADQMLEVLASVNACHSRPFANLESLVVNHVSLVSGIICVLLAWDEPRRQFIAKLKMLGVPMIVLVLTAEDEASLDPGPLREEPQAFHPIRMGAVREGLARL